MQRLIALISVALLAVAFVAVNLVLDRTLTFARLDLTDGGVYTLSAASKRIARSPRETITLKYYFSESVLAEEPQILAEGRRIQELLEAFERASKGKVRLVTIDPEPFSDEEDEAANAGVTPIPVRGLSEPVFLGLAGTNTLTGAEAIPVFRPGAEAERFREFDIAQVIHTLAQLDRPTVGVMTALPVDGLPFNPSGAAEPVPAWQLMRELRAVYNVRRVLPGATSMPDGIDALVVIHPRTSTPQGRYLVDQFALSGKPVVAFLDPASEVDRINDPDFPALGPRWPSGSDLAETLDAWGIDVVDGAVATDTQRGVQQPIQTDRGVANIPLIQYIEMTSEDFSEEDPAVARLNRVFTLTSGFIKYTTNAPNAEDARPTINPLYQTSDQSAPLTVRALIDTPDPFTLVSDFQPAAEPLILAARVTGPAPTGFPDGPPPLEGAPKTAAPEDHRSEAVEAGVNVVLIADADMLIDGAWVARYIPGPDGQPVDAVKAADNVDLLLNLLDSMVGSADLARLRARGPSSRPFTKFQELRRQADVEALAERERLEGVITELIARQRDIALGRATGSPEELEAQAAAVGKELIDARSELRNIRLELDRDIERVQTIVVLINTALVPALLCGMALLLAGYRAVRRRAERARVREG